MDDAAAENPPPDPAAGPPLPPGTAEELFQQAEEARRRQVWEEALRLYRFSLQKDPKQFEALRGLALCFEAKGREPGYESYLQNAMDAYRKMIALDPASGKAHDALMAAALKAGLLDELMDEYKAHKAKGADDHIFREAFKKLQTMLLLRAEPVKRSVAPLPPIIGIIFGFITPGIALISLIGAVLIRVIKGKAINSSWILFSYVLMKISAAAFVVFLGYKVFQTWRANSR